MYNVQCTYILYLYLYQNNRKNKENGSNNNKEEFTASSDTKIKEEFHTWNYATEKKKRQNNVHGENESEACIVCTEDESNELQNTIN